MAQLRPQQRIFALEYLRDRNATQAAIRAGYSARTAGSQAHDLLKKPEIQAIIAEKLQAIEQTVQTDIERVVLELHRILTADIAAALDEYGAFKPLEEWPEDLRRALSGIDNEELIGGPDGESIGRVRKARFWSKTEAANLLLKKLGGFAPQKHEVTHVLADELSAARRRVAEGIKAAAAAEETPH